MLCERRKVRNTDGHDYFDKYCLGKIIQHITMCVQKGMMMKMRFQKESPASGW